MRSRDDTSKLANERKIKRMTLPSAVNPGKNCPLYQAQGYYDHLSLASLEIPKAKQKIRHFSVLFLANYKEHLNHPLNGKNRL